MSVKFGNKYASVDASTIKNDVTVAIRTAIANASSQQANGIMPFLKMLNQDQADLSINVTRDGNTISVSAPTVTPTEMAPKYTNLPSQIQSYLDRNLELFPTKRNGDNVDYSNLTITLSYPSSSPGGVAQN